MAIKVNHLQTQITGLQNHIQHYKNTFKKAPKGYVINNGQAPQFYIPLGNGVFHPAKWIKRTEDGRVTSFHNGQGPNESPYIIDLYVQADTIGHGKENPIELLPGWFRALLLRPSGNFVHLQHEVEDLNDWGMAQEITHFHKLNNEVSLQIEVLYEELDATHDTWTMSKKWLVLTRVSQKTAWLENLQRKVSMPCSSIRHKSSR